jgi:hypothetical protein
MKSDLIYETIKSRASQLKQEGKLTFRMKVFMAGAVSGAVAMGMSLNRAEELDSIIGIKPEEYRGVEELLIFGNVEEWKQSPLKFEDEK